MIKVSNNIINDNFIIINDNKELCFNKSIIACNLDYPSNGLKILSDLKNLHIAGWIICKDWPVDLSLLIVTNVDSYKVELKVNRIDAIKSIFGPDFSDETRLSCGFSTNIPAAEYYKLYILLDDVKYSWSTLSLVKNSINYEKIIKIWSAYSSNDIDGISSADALSVELCPESVIRSIIIGDTKSGLNLSDIIKSNCFNDIDISYMKKFLDLTKSCDVCDLLVKSAIDFGEVSIINPFGEGNSFCRESIHLRNGYTILRFITPNNEIFYIFQHVTSTDAIFFPKRKFVILDMHIGKSTVIDLTVAMCKNFSSLLSYTKKSEDNKFLGVIASHGRPYHFYYDVAPAVQRLHRSNFLEKIKSIVYSEGSDFCSFGKIFKLNIIEETLSLALLADRVKVQCGFYIHVGTRYDRCLEIDVSCFDKKLLNYAKESINNDHILDINGSKKCFPLIWCGVTGQKRSWVEQVEGYSKILIDISKYFPNVGVVFDGWTSPMHPTSSDTLETNRDLDVIYKIKKLLPNNIQLFNVIGFNTIDKLNIATLCDVFIANSATGSLHISRFANVPGVGHLSRQMMNEPGFIRPKLVMVPAQDVIDIPDSNNNRIDYASYSINPIVILDMIKIIIINSSVANRFLR